MTLSKEIEIENEIYYAISANGFNPVKGFEKIK